MIYEDRALGNVGGIITQLRCLFAFGLVIVWGKADLNIGDRVVGFDIVRSANQRSTRKAKV